MKNPKVSNHISKEAILFLRHSRFRRCQVTFWPEFLCWIECEIVI